MDVILLKDTEYGDKGASVAVADGFARNYLIPNGLAIAKTAGTARHVEEVKLHQKNKLAREKEAVEVVAKKINAAAPIVFKAKGRESGQLFGSITHQQIADLINESLKLTVDRRRVGLKSLKEAGLFDVPIKLNFGVVATAKIKVELEVEKKEVAAEDKKKRKPRKKEEILAELEPVKTEAEVEPKANVKAEKTAPVEAAEETKAEKKPRAKKAKKAE
jgi:large subunit ribosomal protein L9